MFTNSTANERTGTHICRYVISYSSSVVYAVFFCFSEYTHSLSAQIPRTNSYISSHICVSCIIVIIWKAINYSWMGSALDIRILLSSSHWQCTFICFSSSCDFQVRFSVCECSMLMCFNFMASLWTFYCIWCNYENIQLLYYVRRSEYIHKWKLNWIRPKSRTLDLPN